MRRVYKIAKAELFTLFYSPIAWLILVIFAFQTGMGFHEKLQGILRTQESGFPNGFLTAQIFSGQFGLFASVQSYLYLYMPLVTMGLMSREFSSGSIKLLYSSPVTSAQIIWGKFMAMMAYGLLLMGVLLIYLLIGWATIGNFEVPAVLSGMLSLYLLLCAYSAIGLFMSSLTSYQVVAALGTLVLLAGLNYVNQVWQSIDFVRDITYWLSISGRCNEMISGLVCSEDVLYFIIVICMFLFLSILKLQANRTHTSFSITWGKYVLVVIVAMGLGYITSRPIFMGYYDATATKVNTLTPKSQEIMQKLDGGLTITTYVNLLDREYYHGIPEAVNRDKERLKQYIRFKPETKMNYVYYYDSPSNNPWINTRFPKMTLAEQAKGLAELREIDLSLFMPPKELKKTIDLTDEGNTFVRLVQRGNGQKAFLRIYDDMMKFPGEAEVTALFKRMVMKLPRVGFLEGHGERSITGDRFKDYTLFSNVKTFRYALTNQGCDVETLSLAGDKQIPDSVDVVVISDMKTELLPEEKAKLDAYIAKGGNLLITLKPGSPIMENFISQFGIKTVPGQLVQNRRDQPGNMVLSTVTPEAIAQGSEVFDVMEKRRQVVGMTNAAALVQAEDKGFTAVPILRTIDTVRHADTVFTFNETETIDFVNDSAIVHGSAGEKTGVFTTAMAVSRKVGNKEQRIMIMGDADAISNAGVSPNTRRYATANFNMIPGFFHWLSYGTVPVDVSRPRSKDNEIDLTKGSLKVVKIALLYVIPGVLILASAIILIRRKRK
ncbi:MAG: Gldg family protein [Candidatus Pseudobacter hemicellulosilyticus]|uniref:Gldg family protein n=1 Tax=Candidatus Pseudobacter hemicellulosilyticus TaxID=3121375 RepID=A0AAJ5WVU2_9BACT|nr:MAG: Gldg family protein [Pseudobacter sp.]